MIDLERTRAAIASVRARVAVFVGALLLSSGSMWLSLSADDQLLYLALAPSATLRGLARAPWDLFSFAEDPAGVATLMEEGVFPWWSDTSARIAFLRPLSSLTHWLDHQLWPGSDALTHLHSWLWFAALLAVVATVYKQLCSSPALAGLAFALFALDDARAYTIAWVCNRNALIALVFGFLALLLHDRGRRRELVAARWLAPLAFTLALSAGETALQVCAYLASYALFMERGPRSTRAWSLAPYAAIVLLWRGVYVWLGYGAHGSGLYVDPGRDPLAFAQAVGERLPVLLAAQYAGVIAELVDGLPVIAPSVAPLFVPLCALIALAVLSLFLPLLRGDRQLCFWLLGSLLATLPVCGVSPSDRVLTATGLGGSAALACLFAAVFGRGESAGLGSVPRLRRAACGVLATVHLGLAPLLLPLRIHGVDRVEDILARADASIPSDAESVVKTLILLNPPLDPLAVFYPVHRAFRGIPRPARTRWLATGVSALTLERVDARSLRLSPRAGFLSNSSQWILRDPRKPPRVGERTTLSDVSFEIESHTPAGLPARALIRFDRPLEHPKWIWRRWDAHGYVAFAPPATGQRLVVPAVDVMGALF